MAHEITISWTPVPGATSYNIFRGTAPGNESTVPYASVNAPNTTFVDTQVFAGRVYSYEITSVINGVQSADSNGVLSAPVPFPPDPSPIEMGAASSFEILAGSAVTNVPGSDTQVSGDVGVFPGTSITGFTVPPANISGVFHLGDFVAAAAQSALTQAYNSALAVTGATTLSGDIGGQSLLPGIYASASSLAITGSLVLDAQGDPNAFWIFQIGSTLTTATNNSQVVLMGGAQANNVIWAVGSSATLGTNTHMAGNILAQVSITLNTGASLNGRALASTGAVTLDGNNVIMFTTASLSSRKNDSPMTVGQIIFDCASQTFQEVLVGGKTGNVQPVFSIVPGVLTKDGSVEFGVVTGIILEVPLPPSNPNVPPPPPPAPINLVITSEA